jgi:hypothetical protein
MNVAELIDILRSYPAEARIVVQGYEFGFDDITSVARQPLAIGANLTARPGFGGGEVIPAEYGAGAHDSPSGGTPPDEFAVYLKGAPRR